MAPFTEKPRPALLSLLSVICRVDFYHPSWCTMDINTIYALSCAVVVAISILSYRSHRFGSESLEKSTSPKSGERFVCLRQVHPPDLKTKTDIDIIAIHGLDTRSPGTWEYKQDGKPPSNWLKDEDMLPSRVGNARIFTCDWPAKQFESSEMAQLHTEELVRPLVASINARSLSDQKDRPILFIASCLGGVILMKALTDSIQADSIRSSTRAVIFLATPFSGTSFGKIAYWVNPILSVQAWLIGARLTPRHDYVEGGRWEVSNLTHKFVQLGLNQDYSIFVFYETLPTNLLAKYLPQALRWLSKDELVSYPRVAYRCTILKRLIHF